MTFRSLAADLRNQVVSIMFDSQCLIYSPDDAGVWHPKGMYYCSVQARTTNRISNASVEDPDISRSRERITSYLYVDQGSGIEIGDRMLWRNSIWTIGSATTDRSIPGVERFMVINWQSAVTPEKITFWRVTSVNDRDVLGEYSVRLVYDSYSPLVSLPRSEFYGNTARGNYRAGTIIGDEAIADLKVGDWFTKDGSPGRITWVNTSDPERTLAGFTTDRQAI